MDAVSQRAVEFAVFVHPYQASEMPDPGHCVVSQQLDLGVLSGPIYCEGLNLKDSFRIRERIVKYGWETDDTSADCTMNTPCPIKVPPATRYATTYVFVVPDKGRGNVLEFHAGYAARGPTQEVNGFPGTARLLRDVVIPSLHDLTDK